MNLIRTAFVTISLLIATPAFAQGEAMPAGFADLVEKLSPAVVNISTTQKVKQAQAMFGMPFEGLPNTPEMEPFREFFERFGHMQGGQPQEREVYSLGSGFVIDAKGFVITNNHVIEDAQDINVTFADNSKYKATVIGRDKKTDLALLKIEAKKELPFVPMGDSDAMRVGDWVIAIGNPFGLGGSVTQGIISARARSINAGPFDDFLQTDAPINRGNSGGPLFNTKGEVIGINSAIFSPSGGSVGIGFAIPTALAKPIVEQLKQFGRTHRGWLGIKIQEVSEEVADSVGLTKPIGALVLDVSKGSPSDKAGIAAGDIITHFAGKEITEMRQLPRLVAETKIGASVPLTFWHNGASKTVQVMVGELEEEADGSAPAPAQKGELPGKAKPEQNWLGMTLVPLNPALRQDLQLDAKLNGLVVTEVKPGSEASGRGIKSGDVVSSVNGKPISSVAEFSSAFEAAKKQGRKFALVKILRGKEEGFIALPTAAK